MKKAYKVYKTKSLNDIYPLTIIITRLGTYVIFQSEAEREFVQNVQVDIEIGYKISEYLHKYYGTFCPKFGLGASIDEAFLDYQNREFDNEDN